MRIIADLHIHSKYARACSPRLTLENIDAECARKGVQLVAAPDWTHPKNFQEIKDKLESAEEGVYRLKGGSGKTLFIMATEVACIFSQGGKLRRVHFLIFAPSIESAGKLNAALAARGCKLASDGRPIFGLSGKALLTIMLEVDPRMMLVPAHAWTPWFAIFGSKSGFDTVEECFEELTPHIRALETGLSSDPAMNWRYSKIDDYTLVSNSDAHSLPNIGREANVFDFDRVTFSALSDAIAKPDLARFLYTIEFYPEEGKYHFDGHRDCKISLHPRETKKHKSLCPKCGKPLVIGVLSRVEELADRPEGYQKNGAIPYKSLIALDTLIASSLRIKSVSGKVRKIFEDLCRSCGGEFAVLLDCPISEIAAAAGDTVAEGVARMRVGRVRITPGYDGEYGKIFIFDETERKNGLQTQEAMI